MDATGHVKLTDFGLATGALNPQRIESMKIKASIILSLSCFRDADPAESLIKPRAIRWSAVLPSSGDLSTGHCAKQTRGSGSQLWGHRTTWHLKSLRGSRTPILWITGHWGVSYMSSLLAFLHSRASHQRKHGRGCAIGGIVCSGRPMTIPKTRYSMLTTRPGT